MQEKHGQKIATFAWYFGKITSYMQHFSKAAKFWFHLQFFQTFFTNHITVTISPCWNWKHWQHYVLVYSVS